MKIFIGSDHAGFYLKGKIVTELSKLISIGKLEKMEIEDCGTSSTDSCDYPDFAHAVARKVLANNPSRGILICGSGIGMSIAANRHQGIRAALCHNALEARLARQHNDANVLALGARLIGEEHALECVYTFLTTNFEGGRHERRVKKIEEIG